ncbi:MAG: hypothetical protein JWQ25_20 [Daejeonella sp.]|nr:hypothetical protein [Daejeonella sp.]
MESTDKPNTASRKVKVDVLKEQNDQLQSKLQEQLEEARQKDLELQKLKAVLVQKDGQLNVYKYQSPDYSRKEEKVFLTKPIFYGMIAILVGLAAISAYSFFFKKEEKRLGGIITYADISKDGAALDPTDSILMDIEPSSPTNISHSQVDGSTTKELDNTISSKPRVLSKNEGPSELKSKEKSKRVEERVTVTARKPQQGKVTTKTPLVEEKVDKPKEFTEEPKKKLSVTDDEDPNYVELPPQGKYYVNVPRAYLYDQPDMKTKGYFYMVPSNNSILFSLDEKNGFIFVEFTSSQGLDLRGWIKTSDLVKIN